MIRSILFASTFGMVLIGAAGVAHAALIVSAEVGGGPAGGVNYVNFDNLPIGNAGGASGAVGVSFSSGDGAVVTGATSKYAAPYLSNANGNLFGNPNNGADATPYLSSGIGSLTLTFSSDQQYLGLLWGSVDSYNTLRFYEGVSLVGSITGTDVWANANGDQGVNGTYYVNITSDLAFDSVIASSTNYAFEIDNVAFNSRDSIVRDVPEPVSLSLFLTGLVGLAGLGRVRRRRAKT